jgi:undecaprenyl pyrophosphate phosphatase UppP
MSTADGFVTSRNWWVELSGILRNLQTWWLLLTVSEFVLAILLVLASRRGSSDVEQLTLILAAAMFLGGMILSTIHTERNAQDRDDPRDDPFTWLARLRCTMAMGIAVVVGFAASHTNEHPVAIASVGVLAAGAAWTAGILLGFIFGLPQPAKGDTNHQSGVPTEGDQSPTNLEHIADWLTKLILGAGLTQIDKIPGMSRSLATYIGKRMGVEDTFELFALAICIFFFSCGFLFGYLWGRLVTPDTFRMVGHRHSNRGRKQTAQMPCV